MKKLLFLIIFTVLLVGCNKDTNNINFTESSTLIMTKENSLLDGSSRDFFVKSKEGEICKVPYYSDEEIYTYLQNSDSFLYIDQEKNLQKVNNSGQSELIGTNVVLDKMEDVNKNYLDFVEYRDFGYMPNISESLYPNDFEKSYGASMNGKTIAYIDSNLNLYVKKDDKDCKKVDSCVTSFTIDYTGEYVYYLKNSEELYVYHNDEFTKIANNVNQFLISKNGEKVIWLSLELKMYIKDLSEGDKNEICAGEQAISAKIYDDTVLYLRNTSDDRLDLYLYSKGKSEFIESDVFMFSQDKEKIYYIDSENNLWETDANDLSKKNKIKIDVMEFKIEDSVLYFLDNDSNLYKKEENKDYIQIANDVAVDGYTIVDGNIIYKNNRNQIFVNDENIGDCKYGFCFNSSYVAYIDKQNQVHIYDAKNKKDSIEIEDAKKYSSIYLGDKPLYQYYFSLEDIQGYWNSVDGNFILNGQNVKMLEFKDCDQSLNECKLVAYFYNNTNEEHYCSLFSEGGGSEISIDQSTNWTINLDREGGMLITTDVGSYYFKKKVSLGIKGLDAKSYIEYTNQQLSSESGVYVSEIISGSPAENAGIKSGDIITKIDNIELPVMSDLVDQLNNYNTGDKVVITVNRNGKEITLDVIF
ncbi:MAG: PDZ domain-containing protein [Intestinibacter sp.]